MWRLFGFGKQDAEKDKPRTSKDDLEARVESLESRQRRLADTLAELEDGITRRLDKYRKRMEREDAAGAPELGPEETRGVARPLAPRPASIWPGESWPPKARVLPFDALAVRRGKGTFPGGGR